jgi:cell division septation protein DedD
MRNKDTGEFELVVGDKQLLSAFFIGVVLLAVVFAMGYVLGRSSPKSATVPAETAAVSPNSVTESRPAAAPPALPPSAEPPASTTPADSGQAAVEPPPQPTTVPARDTAAADPPATDPADASYWQVTAAANKNSADNVSQTLKSKGFPAAARPGPNNLTVVWVGPYTDKASLTRAKKQLEDAGFNPIKKP